MLKGIRKLCRIPKLRGDSKTMGNPDAITDIVNLSSGIAN